MAGVSVTATAATAATEKVSPLTVNAYSPSAASSLNASTRDRIERRRRVLGESSPLLYSQPLDLVSGEGVWLTDRSGRRYLDMYNNVAGIGHSHPRVAAAVADQLTKLNTHTRYLHDSVLNYAEDLASTFPDPLSVVMFTCTGSEANDLALQLARKSTGRQGIIVTESAYHGNTSAVSACSPSMQGSPTEPWVRVVPAPDRYRVNTADMDAWFAARVSEQIDDLERNGIGFAALLIDTVFSSDGIFPGDGPFLQGAARAVRKAGGLLITDEVQPGFGRLGAGLWGFERHQIVPDIVTLGKPMGNGIPVAGAIVSHDVVDAVGSDLKYFNTFSGTPVAMAAAQTVLDVIHDEGLVTNAHDRGIELLAGLRRIQAGDNRIGDVRGIGLFAGVEFVADPLTRTPDPDTAISLVNRLRENGILISAAGVSGNVLKIRPPLPLSEDDVTYFLDVFDRTLAKEDRRP